MAWYFETYPDVRRAGADPLEHYPRWGRLEGRRPNAEAPDPKALLDVDWYTATYPDVGVSGLGAQRHFALYGKQEGRRPNALALSASTGFDPAWYLAAYPDVRDAGFDPAIHYALHGLAEGRRPHARGTLSAPAAPPTGRQPFDLPPAFDADAYLVANPDVREAGMDPAVHYIAFGRAEGRAPDGRRPEPYSAWRRRAMAAAAPSIPTKGPLISLVLPVYRVTPAILTATLESLKAQTYDRWEACIAFADPDQADTLALLRRQASEDTRFKLVTLDRNLGISGNSNAALALAQGDYVGLLDHDDELTPRALAWIVAAIAAEPDADFLYTDKELLSEDGGERYSPLFKPAWSPETLYSVNYLTHFNVIAAPLMESIGGWSSGVDGAQDWDLFLRATERARRIVRVPGVAYSWRVHAGSTSSGMASKPYALAAQLTALSRHAVRIGLPGSFEPDADTGFNVEWRDVPRVRVLVLGAGEPEPLLALLGELATQREAFVGVDVLVTPSERWALLSAWRARCGDWPTWCELHRIAGHDPVKVCAARLASVAEPVTVVVDGSVESLAPGGLRRLAGWLHAIDGLAFASGLALLGENEVVEAGCVADEAGVVHPLFRGAALRGWGLMGGPLWRRNVDAASPYMLALRTADAGSALARLPGMSWQDAFHRLCADLVATRPEGRGLVEPSARARVAPGLAFAPPAEGMIGTPGRHLHPYLTLAAGGGIIFGADRSVG